MRHAPAGEGGSLTVPTAHGPPHPASGRRFGSRLFIIKPVKNTSQTASELRADGRCLHRMCAWFTSSHQPSAAGITALCGCPRPWYPHMLSQAGPRTLCITMLSLVWSAEQDEVRVRAQPCSVHRETERLAATDDWRKPARPPRPDDRFCCPGETQAPPGVRRGHSISWSDQSRFATISLRVLRWLQRPWGTA